MFLGGSTSRFRLACSVDRRKSRVSNPTVGSPLLLEQIPPGIHDGGSWLRA